MRVRVYLGPIVAQGKALREEVARLSVWKYREAAARVRHVCPRCLEQVDGPCDGCRDVLMVKQEARREAHVASGRCRCGRKRDSEHRQCRWCRASDARIKRAR